jgi:hypothetical protein
MDNQKTLTSLQSVSSVESKHSTRSVNLTSAALGEDLLMTSARNGHSTICCDVGRPCRGIVETIVLDLSRQVIFAHSGGAPSVMLSIRQAMGTVCRFDCPSTRSTSGFGSVKLISSVLFFVNSFLSICERFMIYSPWKSSRAIGGGNKLTIGKSWIGWDPIDTRMFSEYTNALSE